MIHATAPKYGVDGETEGSPVASAGKCGLIHNIYEQQNTDFTLFPVSGNLSEDFILKLLMFASRI